MDQNNISSYEVEPLGGLGHLVLFTTTCCNFRCKYCFEDHSNCKHMDKKIAKPIIDRFIDSYYFNKITNNNSKKNESLKVSFFGGEPLLNLDFIKWAVDYIDKQVSGILNVSYGLTTNGSLLTKEVVDYLASHRFSIILSLDGPKEINDINRVDIKGNGTFDIVAEKIPYLLEKMPGIAVRPSYVPDVVNKLYSIVAFFRDMGFTTISPIPVHDTGGVKSSVGWTDEVYSELSKQMWAISQMWYDHVIVKGNKLNIKFIFDFFRDFMQSYKPQEGMACGTGIGYAALGTNGYLYPCHRWVHDIEEKKYRMYK